MNCIGEYSCYRTNQVNDAYDVFSLHIAFTRFFSGIVIVATIENTFFYLISQANQILLKYKQLLTKMDINEEYVKNVNKIYKFEKILRRVTPYKNTKAIYASECKLRKVNHTMTALSKSPDSVPQEITTWCLRRRPIPLPQDSL